MNKFTRSEKIEKKKNKTALYILIASIIFVTVSFAIYGVVQFINTHDFVFPITFHNPIPLKKNPVISPLGHKKKTSMIQMAYADTKPQESQPESIQSIVNKIYTLESSQGRNDSCISKDQGVNGYGYMQSTYYWNCYSTHAEVESLVTSWVNDKLTQGYSLPELLCTYNAGIKESNCPYYQKYLSL